MNIKYNAPYVIEESFFSYNPEKESREEGFEILIPLGYKYVVEPIVTGKHNYDI